MSQNLVLIFLDFKIQKKKIIGEINYTLVPFMSNKMKDQYDAIVIGSGVGGSGCAALLTAAGYDTLMIEKNERLGGACSSYYKKGYTIDVAVHMFSGSKHFNRILKKTGHPGEIDFIKTLGERSIILTKNAPPLHMFSEGMRPGTRPVDGMNSSQSALKGLGFSDKDIEDLFNVFLQILAVRKNEILDLMHVPLSEWINQFTDSDAVYYLMSYVCGIFFVIPIHVASAGEFVYSLQKGIPTITYPRGGAIAIPNAFGKIVQEEGGKILMNTRVKKILLDENKVEGVLLTDDRMIKAPIIVSNAGIKPTIFNLLSSTSMLGKKYLQKVENLIPSFSSITFKVALNKQIITEYDAMHIFNQRFDEFQKPDTDRPWDYYFEEEQIRNTQFMVPIPSNMDPSLAPKGKQLIIFGCGAPPKLPSGKNWKFLIDTYWELILDLYPDIEKNLDFLDITTPEHIIQYTGKSEAPVEGTAFTIDQVGEKRISSRIPNIEGLYIAGDTAGQNAHGVGTEMAVNSGILVFNMIQQDYPKLCKKHIKIKA